MALPVAALGIVSLLAGRRRGQGVVALCWLLTALAVVVAQGRYFTYHWVPLSAVLAVAAAVGCARLVDARVPAAVAAGALLLVTAWSPLDASVRRVVDDRPYDDAFVVGDFSAVRNVAVRDWLRRHTEPGDAVLVWGDGPAVHFLSDRPAASRFADTLPVVGLEGRTELVDEYRAELVAELGRRPPPHVVVFEGLQRGLVQFPQFESFVSFGYVEAATIGS